MRVGISNRSASEPAFPLRPAAWQHVIAELKLSPQQARIVEQILLGKRDKQIALALGLELPTIRTYLRRIFDRADVSDRMELVLRVFTIAQGLREQGDRHSS